MASSITESRPYQVPRSRVHLTHRRMREEILRSLEPLLFDGRGEGAAVRCALEQRFAATMGQRHASAVHSGTVGLFLALKACGVAAGHEVITVGNSDISTTAAISHCGARPVLCDVLTDDYTINPDLVEALITERTCAILPVDLYGHPADVAALRPIADRHGLKIIEDAALATGASDRGAPVGAYADVAVFSFAPFKPLGCAGNGAMVTTGDDTIAERLQLLCSYGHDLSRQGDAPGHQRHVIEGYNMPLDPLEAALLAVKLPHLDEWTAVRRTLVEAYRAGLQDLSVHLPVFRRETAPTFRCYTILVPDQGAVYEGLLEAGIEAVLHYVPPVYRQLVYAARPPAGSDRLAVTERLARHLVCLPVSPELDLDDVGYVVDVLRRLIPARTHASAPTDGQPQGEGTDE